ncbi:MAG: hypothetical protein K5905_07095 [Roseibium sp.]|uniref:hypothetical protein n=1 Tax=Roseibium sp. TaxID=1936156 RepID=UPI00260F2575|nr:hypothetical protein [Roseibium sp.]MCV0425221.1 hypothetical protein [Roseibium sp.]
MRRLLIALLLLVFAGIHSVAAMSPVEPDTVVVSANSLHPEGDLNTDASAGISHHAQCCDFANKSGGTGKISNCSADCASFKVEDFIHQFASECVLETTPLPGLTDFSPVPQDRPPKKG